MQLSQVLAKPSGAFILDSENRKVLAVLGANSEIHKRMLIVAAAARDLGAEVAEMNETQWLNQIPNLGARLQAIIGPFNAWRISTGFKLTPEPWQRMGPMLRDAQGKLIGMIESMAQPVSVFRVLELAPTLVYELDQIVRELADDEALTSERSDELKSRLQSLSRHS
jgi:hypothetical protein